MTTHTGRNKSSQWGTNLGSALSGLGSAVGAFGGVLVQGQAAQQAAGVLAAETAAKTERQKQTLHTVTQIAIGLGIIALVIAVLLIITRRK